MTAPTLGSTVSPDRAPTAVSMAYTQAGVRDTLAAMVRVRSRVVLPTPPVPNTARLPTVSRSTTNADWDWCSGSSCIPMARPSPGVLRRFGWAGVSEEIVKNVQETAFGAA